MSLYYLGNARSDVQRQEMVALEAAGLCIFCPSSYTRSSQRQKLLEHEHGSSWMKEVVLETETWVVLRNEYPYPGALHHLMLVPKEHVTRQTDLSADAKAGYWEILDLLVAHLGSDYFVLGSRNGDLRFTGGTIAHLHIQVIVGDPDNYQEPVRFYASSVPSHNPSSAES